MTRYEYIRIQIDMGDLKDLNSLSSNGWRVSSVVQVGYSDGAHENYALLERPLPESA